MKLINISLSPNTEKDDVILAFLTLLSPWKWKNGRELEIFKKKLADYLDAKSVFLTNSARSAEYLVLKALNIGNGDEVIVQAFTCIASVAPILWTGAKPVLVDINKDDFNLNPSDLEKKITSKTRAVIVQHTFGIPAKMDKILAICQKRRILVIEDCAHGLGAEVDGKKIGNYGQISFFSFGRDKVISSVFGGAITTNEQTLAKKIEKFYQTIGFPSNFWVVQQLLHPLAFSLILPLYNFLSLGKILLRGLQIFGFLSVPVLSEEKQGEKPKIFPKKMPNGLAILALRQLNKLEKFISKRRKIAYFYQNHFSDSISFPEKAGFLRYPFLTKNPQKIINYARKKGVLLGDWYRPVIAPKGVNFRKIGYKMGSCPIAEDLSKKILNLPTGPNIDENDAHNIISLVKIYGN